MNNGRYQSLDPNSYIIYDIRNFSTATFFGETMFDSLSVKPYRTKEEYVYETLRAAIMAGNLRPGDKLVIDSLKVELDVSTIPIRTALQRLEGQGLVNIRPHTGAVVSNISLHDVAEIFTLLEALESIAFGAASQKITPPSLTKIEAIVKQMDDAVKAEDSDKWASLNSEFHIMVAHVAGMPLLKEFTARVLGRWDRIYSLYLREYVLSRMADAQEDHHQMIQLLKIQDADGLSELAKQHNHRALEAFRAYTAADQSENS
ncbi:MAG: GntR family transcriptional regulator [Chloroflexi bacterium]|nr:MAG: GntR family transcriptional regulator [Chloroflexota bacterium]